MNNIKWIKTTSNVSYLFQSVATVTPEIFSSFTQHSTTDHHYTTSFTHHPDTTLDIDVATAGFHHRTEVAPSQISDSTTDRHYTTSFTQPPETTLDIDVTTAGSRHRTEVTSSQVSETPRTRVDIPYTPQVTHLFYSVSFWFSNVIFLLNNR